MTRKATLRKGVSRRLNVKKETIRDLNPKAKGTAIKGGVPTSIESRPTSWTC